MSQLYKAVQVIDSIISNKGLDATQMRGLIGMKAGFFLIVIKPDTPDDPQKLAALRGAAEEVLGQRMPF
ncbi:MAG: hypothetical protein U1E29_12965 [Coriobacteriia bacterium]|nr:hypothetical protein [Coriobacteriia bacterium]